MVIILLLIFLIPFFWNSYYSILFFITLIFFNCVILYFLGVFFLALSLVLIYSGAIPILIIFIVKLVGSTRTNNVNFKHIYLKFFFFLKIFFIISLILDLFFFNNYLNLVYFTNNINDYNFFLNFFNVSLFSKPGMSSIDIIYIKDFFYGIFLPYFIVSTILLLVSMIGSISIILLPNKN